MEALESALIDAMWVEPDDPGPRLVYEDWLADSLAPSDGRLRYLRADDRFAADPTDVAAWSDLAEARHAVASEWMHRAAWSYAVVLEDNEPTRRILTVKNVRLVTGLGLRESLDLVNAVPTAIVSGLDGAMAEAIRRTLEHNEGGPNNVVAVRRLREPPTAQGPGGSSFRIALNGRIVQNREAVRGAVARALGLPLDDAQAVMARGTFTKSGSHLEHLLLGYHLQHLLLEGCFAQLTAN